MSRIAALILTICLVCAGSIPAQAEDAPTIENDIVLTSFDGTPIVATLMLPPGASPSSPVPVVLNTHGFGARRAQKPTPLLQRLIDEGYAVMTWDSRGFGESGGEVHLSSPAHEVKDAQAIISYVASRPEIALEASGDPKLGWTGASYGGGIQIITAAVDNRVDAIVPAVTWGDLNHDLAPNDVFKQTWGETLYAGGIRSSVADGAGSPAGPQHANYSENVHTMFQQYNAFGQLSAPIKSWLKGHSTWDHADRVSAPTLLIQGTTDTIFGPENGFHNYEELAARGTPVKLLALCGGHMLLSGCPYDTNATRADRREARETLLFDATVTWLDRYVSGEAVSTGPAIEWEAPDGNYYRAPSFPLAGTTAVTGTPLTTGMLVGSNASGGDDPTYGKPVQGAEIFGRTAARRIVLSSSSVARNLVGIPKLQVSGRLTGGGGNLYFELVDVSPENNKRVTVDGQVMPLRVTGGAFNRTFDMHGIAWRLEPGHSLELEITTGSAMYQAPRLGSYSVNVTAAVTLPVADAQ